MEKLRKEYTKNTGGLVLKKKHLEAILCRENTLGIAFALRRAGFAKNVNLEVIRILKKDHLILGEKCKIYYRTGAYSPLEYSSNKVEDFRFKLLNRLKDEELVFDFFSNAQFNQLFKVGWNEIFIGGDIQKIKHKTHFCKVDTKFTFTLSPRLEVRIESFNNLCYHLFKQKLEKEGCLIDLTCFENEFIIPKMLGRNRLLISREKKVTKILLDDKSIQILGLELKSKEGYSCVLFTPESQVKSVLLNDDKSLAVIFLKHTARYSEVKNLKIQNFINPRSCNYSYFKSTKNSLTPSSIYKNSIRDVVEHSIELYTNRNFEKKVHGVYL